MSYLKVDWDDIECSVYRLYQEIKKTYQPDYIISIGRGGLVPARIFCDLFSIKDISIISCFLYNGIKSKNDKIIFKNFNDIIENKAVLVVDDICDTGETIYNAVQFLSTKKYFNLKVVTLFCRESCNIKPTYVDKIIKDEWVIFPWEKTEFKNCN